MIEIQITEDAPYKLYKFHKPHSHLQKPCELWRLKILSKWHLLIIKAVWSAENVLIIKEKLDICKLMAIDRSYMEHYGSGQSTTVAKS